MNNLKKIEKGLSIFVKIADAIVTIAAAFETIKPIINKTIIPLIKECKDYSDSFKKEESEEETDVILIDEE